MSDKFRFAQRGVLHIQLGGQERVLRFRAQEIDLLEQRTGMGVMQLLDGKMLGLRLLKEAIIVGQRHEYANQRGGKKVKALTENEVLRWIDRSEDEDGIEFEDLFEAVTKAIVGGLPNGARLIRDMDAAEAAKKADAKADDDEARGEVAVPLASGSRSAALASAPTTTAKLSSSMDG